MTVVNEQPQPIHERLRELEENPHHWVNATDDFDLYFEVRHIHEPLHRNIAPFCSLPSAGGGVTTSIREYINDHRYVRTYVHDAGLNTLEFQLLRAKQKTSYTN